MGAAEGDLAGAEIIEQGPSALHLRKVEFACLSLGAGCHFAATEWHDWRVHNSLFSRAMGAAAGGREHLRRSLPLCRLLVPIRPNFFEARPV